MRIVYYVSYTYLNTANGSYSVIDLTVTDPSLLIRWNIVESGAKHHILNPLLLWYLLESTNVHANLCVRDHLFIILEMLYFFTQVKHKLTRYTYDKSNWSLYEQMYKEEL